MKASVSVAIVSICGPAHLRRCLEALRKQVDVAPFEVVVAYDPELKGLPDLAREYPEARFLATPGERTPLELAARALRESRGEVLLLTEDHCVPEPDWVRSLPLELRNGRAAAGGTVNILSGAGATDWAFYFVDFFRYAEPVIDGPSPTLTVCNVAYRRDQLNALQGSGWRTFFHETIVNDTLRMQFGELYLTSKARVSMARHVSLGDAIRERYAFGRLFGCMRLRHLPRGMRRLAHQVGAPLLPLLLMGRMASKALKSPALSLRFGGAFVPLTLMVLAWSWGEWLGYLTDRYPSRLTTAPETE